MASPAPVVRPFTDDYLLDYSQNHVYYEFDMFLWLGRTFGPTTQLRAPTEPDVQRLNNLVIEGFAIHLRNVLDFFYVDVLRRGPRPTDVVAADFLEPGDWQCIRPALPDAGLLRTASFRADKEIAHLTTDRKPSNAEDRGWDFAPLAAASIPVMRLFADRALPSRLAQNVRDIVPVAR